MKRGGLAIVGVGIALLVAIGGVVVWQQRSQEEGIRVSPYWLVERGGVVIRLVEQYLP